MVLRPKRKLRSLNEIENAVNYWIDFVNERLDAKKHPWTAAEIVNGRIVPIDTLNDDVLTGLRTRYFESDWEVYAMIRGGTNGVKETRYLEFWRGAS